MEEMGKYIGAGLATGGSRAEVEKALTEAITWFETATVIRSAATPEGRS